MTDSHRRSRKRPTLVEGFHTVPHILEEARRAVDDVTRPGRTQGGGGETPAVPKGRKGSGAAPLGQKRQKGPKAAPRTKAAKARGPQKKPSRPPAAKKPPAAPDIPAGGLALAHFGIQVKHAIPGRLRLRLYHLLHNDSMAAKLPALLAAVPGVTAVEASTNTGSLLITYLPGELAAPEGRRGLAVVLQQFFPGFDTESLIKRMLGTEGAAP